MLIYNWKLFNESLQDKPIQNIETYINRMSLSMEDKLFFNNILTYDCIVDFGCADGKLLEIINQANPDIKIIGYDIDPIMINKAKNNLPKSALITDNWNLIINEVKKYKLPLINLSSVIHEVYSYSTGVNVKKFWEKQVFGGLFKYIAIRDMIPSVAIEKNQLSEYSEDVKKVKDNSDPYYLDSFEKYWGSISSGYRKLTHYLLKYRFTDNWEREMHENYLPLTLETLYKKIPTTYKIIFQDNFILPFQMLGKVFP